MDLELNSLAAQGLPRYIRLVADALGLVGESSFVQLEPPANAYLALDDRLPLFPEHDVALIWDEEHGWAAGIESDSGRDLIVLSYLGDNVLPAPWMVARFAQRVFGQELPGQPEPPVLRDMNDDDDLQARLAGYARTGATEPYWAATPEPRSATRTVRIADRERQIRTFP